MKRNETKPTPLLATLRQNSPALITLLVVLTVLGAPVLYQKLQCGTNISVESSPRKIKPQPVGTVSTPRTDVLETVIAKDPTIRFASRASEASALFGATGICAMSLKIDRLAVTTNNLVSRMIEQQLVPPMLSFKTDGQGKVIFYSLDNEWTYEFRVRENPFLVEILALGTNGSSDGEAFMLRGPEVFDEQSGRNQIALYLAPSVKCPLPATFASAGAYFAAGWVRTKFDPENYSSFEREKLTFSMAGQKEGGRNVK